MRPVVGRHRSSRFLLHVAKKFHGVAEETVLNGQPATVKVSFAHTIGLPAACALELDVEIVTVPPCGHMSWLEVVSRLAITSPRRRRR